MGSKGKWLLVALVAALLVAGCNREVQPQLSESDFTDSLNNYGADVSTVVNEVSQDLLWAALNQLPPGAPLYASLGNPAVLLGALDVNSASPEGLIRLMGAVGALADQNLLTGRWVYDPTIPGWVEDTSYSGDDLVYVWDFQDDGGATHQAELTFDWNYGGTPTVEVTQPYGGTAEVPQDMKITMVIDSTTNAGWLRAQTEWYSSASCGRIAEPAQLTLSGEGGASNSVAFNLSVSVSDTQLASTGYVELSSGSDVSTFDWNVYADGQLIRDSNCFAQDFEADSGHVNFRTSETVGGDTTSFEFNTDFSLNFDAATRELVSADLSNGDIKVNGAVAVTFSGTLDDSNHNCVPGENVTLTFADGTTTLEQYLIDEQGAVPGSCP